jgi:Concanavalin A-like lectin/glucanases superfamily/Putative metal-binding motif
MRRMVFTGVFLLGLAFLWNDSWAGSSSLSFDGIAGQVTVPDTDSLNLTGTATFELWFRPTDTRDISHLLSRRIDCGVNINYQIYLLGGTPDHPGSVSFISGGGANVNVSTSFFPPVGEWTHVAVTLDGSNIQIYTNGNLMVDTPFILASVGPANLEIGHAGTCINTQKFAGDIAEVRIWNYARSADQVRGSMTQCVSNESLGLLGYWPFNEGSGQVVHDRSSYHNDGYLGQMPINDGSDPSWIASGPPSLDSDGDDFGDACDCNPSDPTVYPGAPDLCDGKNNDCNDPLWPLVAANEADTDGDGFLVCDGDCDDSRASVHPGAPEVCDGLDNDCNGLIDEDGAGLDSDGDGIHNACDNCRFAYNPTQQDTDHDGAGNACDNCIAVVNPNQADLDGDQRGDVCDNCPSTYNPFQDDRDSDTVGDACDSCIDGPNPDQGDINHDFVGDVCDLNDGLILISFDDDTSVLWQQENGYESWNLYRGDLGVLKSTSVYTQDPATVPEALHECDLATPDLPDTLTPALGQAFFFLVTGVHNGIEGSLGANSAGVTRPNANPCP